MEFNHYDFNVKCAFFVGATFDIESQGFIFDVELYDTIYTLRRTNRHHKEHLCFHDDWNWLMMVVNRIRESGWRYDVSHHGSVSKSSIINITIWQNYLGGGEDVIVDIGGVDYKKLTIDSIIKYFNSIKI